MARTRRISTITWRLRAVSFFIIPSWHYLAFIKQLIIHPICITRISNSGTRPFFLSDRYHILEMEFRHWSLFLFLIFVVAYAPIRFLKILPNICRITEDLLTLLSFSFARTTHILTTSETLTMLNWRKLNTLSRKRDDKVRYYGKQYFKTKRLSGLFPKRLTSKKQTYSIQSLLLHHHIAPVRLRSYYVRLSNIRLLQITDQVGVLLPRALSPIASFHKKRWLYEYFPPLCNPCILSLWSVNPLCSIWEKPNC